MKLAWFTPFATNSAIGKVSRIICEELAKNYYVDIWTPKHTEYLTTHVNCRVFESHNFMVDELHSYDFVFYNMGNYAMFHKEIYDVSLKYSGIIVLHDRIMNNFFQDVLTKPELGGHFKAGRYKFQELITTYYGDFGKQAIENAYLVEDSLYMGDVGKSVFGGVQFPLLPPILETATAVFTHSENFKQELLNIYNGPVDFAYLPVEFHKKTTGINSLPDQVDKGDRLMILSIGMVNEVKQIHVMTDVLLQNPDLQEKVCYVVIGGIGDKYGAQLESLSQTHLKDTLFMLGYQPDEVMEAYLAEADVCINLRYPNTEACSLSLLEQMAHGKPVIAFNSGVFGEMPDDAVVKISKENESDDLANALRSLIRGKEKRETLGASAAKFIKENCTAELYAKKIINFLNTISEDLPFHRISDQILGRLNSIHADLGFNENNTPATLNRFAYETGLVLARPNMTLLKLEDSQVLGIWAGFARTVSNLAYEASIIIDMLNEMLANSPRDCEIWCYSLNEEEVRKAFSKIINGDSHRVVTVTEKNWIKALNVGKNMEDFDYEVNEIHDNLAVLARAYSNADCFIAASFDLDNVFSTGKTIFVPPPGQGAGASVIPYDIHHRKEEFIRNGAIVLG